MNSLDKDFIKKIFHKENFFQNTKIEYCSVFKNPALNPKNKFSQFERFSATEIFNVPRNILPLFGFPAYGVHCNGWNYKNKSYHMILSKRSENIENFPGLYDNLVGGGQPKNLSLYENLLKESNEEAGLNEKDLQRSRFIALKSYFPIHKENFEPSTIAIYDIEISDLKKLKNQDGEISKFRSFEISEIMTLLEKKLIKPNSVIPIADFLIRKNKKIFCKNTLKEINKYLR